MNRLSPMAEVIVFICNFAVKDLKETIYLFYVTDMIIVPVQNTVMPSSCLLVLPLYQPSLNCLT